MRPEERGVSMNPVPTAKQQACPCLCGANLNTPAYEPATSHLSRRWHTPQQSGEFESGLPPRPSLPDSYLGVLSHSDPMPRTDSAGRILTPSHVGIIYQGHNAVYRGRASPATLRMLPDGRVSSGRALHTGWRYSSALLVRLGASPLEVDQADGDAALEAARFWLAHWLPRLTTPVRHPGNHRQAAACSGWEPVPSGVASARRVASRCCSGSSVGG